MIGLSHSESLLGHLKLLKALLFEGAACWVCLVLAMIVEHAHPGLYCMHHWCMIIECTQHAQMLISGTCNRFSGHTNKHDESEGYLAMEGENHVSSPNYLHIFTFVTVCASNGVHISTWMLKLMLSMHLSMKCKQPVQSKQSSCGKYDQLVRYLAMKARISLEVANICLFLHL